MRTHAPLFYHSPGDDVARSSEVDIPGCAAFMLNMEGMILTWNRGAQELMGFSAQEVIGKHFASLREETVAVDRAPGTILSIAALSGIFRHEGWNLKKDLSRFWADVVIKPVFDQDGSMIGFTNVIVDLSERQSARENLKRSEEQFSRLLKKATRRR